jgi:hypothetical protein
VKILIKFNNIPNGMFISKIIHRGIKDVLKLLSEHQIDIIPIIERESKSRPNHLSEINEINEMNKIYLELNIDLLTYLKTAQISTTYFMINPKHWPTQYSS